MKGISLLIAALLVLSAQHPLQAEDFLLSRKFFGYLALGAGGWYLKEAYDAQQEADKFDDRYKQTEPTDRPARELYDSNRRRYTTRTRVMLALSAGSLLYSVYLMRSQEKEELPLPRGGEGMINSKDMALDIEVGPLERRVEVMFKKWIR